MKSFPAIFILFFTFVVFANQPMPSGVSIEKSATVLKAVLESKEAKQALLEKGESWIASVEEVLEKTSWGVLTGMTHYLLKGTRGQSVKLRAIYSTEGLVHSLTRVEIIQD